MTNPKDEEHSPVCACPDCWPKNEVMTGFGSYEAYRKAQETDWIVSIVVMLAIVGILVAAMLKLFSA